MSKWVDKDVRKIVEETIKKVQVIRKTLEQEEIDKIMPEVVKFYKQHKKDEEIYQDDSGGYIILIEIPEKAEPKASKSQYSDGEQWQIICGWKLGRVSVFGDRKDFWEKTTEQGEIYYVRGWLKEQFDVKGTYGVGTYTDHEGNERQKSSKQKYFRSPEEACEKRGFNLEDLDRDDLAISYTFNAWQNMG